MASGKVGSKTVSGNTLTEWAACHCQFRLHDKITIKTEDTSELWQVKRFNSSLPEVQSQKTLAEKAQTVSSTAGEWYAQAHLTTYVEPGDHLLHHFSFQAWNGDGREIVLMMPIHTEKMLAASTMDWLEQLSSRSGHGRFASHHSLPHG